MELRACDRCDKAFLRDAPLQNLCPKCIQLEEEEFVKVKEYLYSHPSLGLEQLSEATDVPTRTLLRFMQSGRLEIKGSGALSCQSCGVPIDKGTMCEACQAKLLKELRGALTPRPTTPSNETAANVSKKSVGFHSRHK